MDENLAKIRHERSMKDFPSLKLDEDEYVEYVFTRAKVCLIMIIVGLTLGLGVILLAFLLVLLGQDSIDEMGKNYLFIILFSLLAAGIIIALVNMVVYRGNKLIITNKHVIQFLMLSPMVHSMNIIELKKIEDASFKQEGILQTLLNYGTFRLSTVGDETTYTFKYSDITTEELKEVSKLISKKKADLKDKD